MHSVAVSRRVGSERENYGEKLHITRAFIHACLTSNVHFSSLTRRFCCT